MSAQRSPTASIRSAIVRIVNVCGATSPFLDFLPRARRRDRRASPGANRVRRGERRAVSVATGVDEDSPAAIGLAELLRQSLRIARHEHGADLVRELVDGAEVRLAVQRHDDVKALGAGGLDPALEPELAQQVAQRERCSAKRLRILFRRIEIEDTDVRVVEVGCARRPHVRRDAVLIGEPEQRTSVSGDGMMNRAVLLRHLDALQPRGEPLRHVFLDEPLVPDAGGVALHGDRAPLDVRQHDRRDGLVIRCHRALCDPIVGEQHLLGMRDHARSLTTSRALLSVRIPSSRG